MISQQHLATYVYTHHKKEGNKPINDQYTVFLVTSMDCNMFQLKNNAFIQVNFT